MSLYLFHPRHWADFPVPARITRAYIVEVKPGKFMNQRTMGPNASIDLNSPGIKNDNVILGENIKRVQYD